jgi:uncharacterized protein (DUF1499 family)
MSDATSTESSSRIAQAAGALAAASMANVALGIGGVQLGILAPLTGFYLFALAAVVGGLVSFVIGAIAVFRTNGGRDPVGSKRAWTGVAGGFVLLMSVVLGASGGSDLPAINDITTNLADPPGFTAALEVPANRGRDMSYPDDFASQVRDAYPDLAPLRVTGSKDEAYAAALAAAERLGWVVTLEDPIGGRFEAQQSTAVFQFVDDIAVRVVDEGDVAVVDIRSKSRDGRGDLGVNAARIRAFESLMPAPDVASR